MIDAAASLFLLLQIFFVDLLLGADNAIVIALACGRLRPEDTRRAIVLGAGGAIVLRLVMILFANALLGVPLVKLAGAWMLIVIALNVRAEAGADPDDGHGRGGASDFVSAAAIIMLADAAMSLDNVVALAAIAGGSFWLLALGVLISIPILVWGAFILTRVLRTVPEIFTVGAAFLGWIAGGMAATDPLVSGWIDANAPALGVFAPALGGPVRVAAGKGVPRTDRRVRAARRAPPASRFVQAPASLSAPQRAAPAVAASPPKPVAAAAAGRAPEDPRPRGRSHSRLRHRGAGGGVARRLDRGAAGRRRASSCSRSSPG